MKTKEIMKTTVRKVLFGVLVHMVTFGYAATPTNKHIESEELLTVKYDNIKSGSILFIKDNQGIVLYRELINKTGDYTKKFDLTSLPNGNYILELEDDVKIKITPFFVKSNSIAFEKENSYEINKPIVYVKGDNVIVSKLSLNGKPLSVSIYYKNNELVFNETIQDEGWSIGRKYDFSTSAKGEYKVVTKTEGRVFRKSVYIK